MIDTIIFDLGNVILPFDFNISLKKFVEISSFEMDFIEEFFFKSGLKQKFDKGQFSANEFYEKVCRGIKVNIEFDKFKDIWSDIFIEDKKINNLIKLLKNRGYNLILFSDTDTIHFDYFQKNYDFLTFFDDFILSFRTGFIKTEKSALNSMLSTIKSRPENAIFIDDKEENLKYPREYKINCILYKDYADLILRFQKLGIVVSKHN